MKKTLSLLLVLCLVCAVFTGCKSKKKETASDGFQFPDQDQSQSLQESQAAPTAAPALPQEPTEFVDLEEPTEPETERDPDRYEPGYRTEDYWCSEFMGLQFHLPAGYFMADDAYHAELMQISLESMGEYGQILMDYAQIYCVYEMMAQDKWGNNVIVMAEQNVQNVDIDEYMDALIMKLTALGTHSLRNLDTINFCGEEYSCLDMVADYNGVTVYQRFLLRVKGDRIIGMVMSGSSTAALDSIMEDFEAY